MRKQRDAKDQLIADLVKLICFALKRGRFKQVDYDYLSSTAIGLTIDHKEGQRE